MGGDRQPGLGHLPAAVGPRLVVDDDDLVEELHAQPDGQARALAEVAGPAHRAGADVEGVEVDVGELEQRRSEHVALAVRLLDDQPVVPQRLHDAVHRRGRQVEDRAQLGDAEVPRALQRREHAGRAVDRLDHPSLLSCSRSCHDRRPDGPEDNRPDDFREPLDLRAHYLSIIRHCRMCFASHGRSLAWMKTRGGRSSPPSSSAPRSWSSSASARSRPCSWSTRPTARRSAARTSGSSRWPSRRS